MGLCVFLLKFWHTVRGRGSDGPSGCLVSGVVNRGGL